MAETRAAQFRMSGLVEALAAVTTRLDASQLAVNQTAHGFSVGTPVRFDGTNYLAARANTVANSEVIGVVSAVADANNFTITLPGNVVSGLSGLTPGYPGFLSSATAGVVLETDAPDGAVSKPVWVALTTTSALLIACRGIYKVAGSNPTLDVFNETPIGDCDGNNTVFTLAFPVAANSLRLILNGVQRETDTDFTLDVDGITLTFLTAPINGAIMIAHYTKA